MLYELVRGALTTYDGDPEDALRALAFAIGGILFEYVHDVKEQERLIRVVEQDIELLRLPEPTSLRRGGN